MVQKTSKYLSVLLISLLLTAVLPLQAQERPYSPSVPKRVQKAQKKAQEIAKPEEIVPLYNGLYIGADVFGIGSKLFGGDMLSSELQIQANLKNRFLPTVEVGYGITDEWNNTGIHYKSKAPYFRLGIDYNTMSKKKEKNSFLFVGVRYGISKMKYDVRSLPVSDSAFGDELGNNDLKDGAWGNESSVYDHAGQKATMQWMEVVLGVKVEIYKQFYMSWSVRSKHKLSSSNSEYGDPWMVPGFGKYGSSTIGITYSLIYKLP